MRLHTSFVLQCVGKVASSCALCNGSTVSNLSSTFKTVSLSRKYLLNVKHDSEVRKKCRREAEKGKDMRKEQVRKGENRALHY